jgi:hypothetical protein
MSQDSRPVASPTPSKQDFIVLFCPYFNTYILFFFLPSQIGARKSPRTPLRTRMLISIQQK